MSELPVREIVLYKHGVGFFVREGKVEGVSIVLSFHQDEINDVLKSLTVFDRAGGQILGIHYQTPMDKETRLANSSVRLEEYTSMTDLIYDLRGRQATLAFETTPGTKETVTGRVIGMDRYEYEDEADPQRVVIREDDKQVRIFPFAALRSVQIDDVQAKHDLDYFLDTSMGEDNRRTVNVRMTPGEHELLVSYVTPSPTWRVSYRIVADSGRGKALLQGWGLFDNSLEEDLQDVKVTLMAGQPISFIYDLYASKIPQRPTVKDTSRIAPGPVEFSDGVEEVDTDKTIMPFRGDENKAVPRFATLSQTATPSPFAQRTISPYSTERMAEDVKPKAPPVETRDAGEFFQYVVTNPVSVKRGESALVPIINTEVDYTCELLYNGAKLPNHPVVSLRFRNLTGLTLERGPVTVVEDSDYKGEAVVAFTKPGSQVYLPYAVELGVKITEHQRDTTEVHGVQIEGAFLAYEEYQVEKVKYILENVTQEDQTVTIEAPVHAGNDLFDTPEPDVETANERRWRVNVKAGKKAEFTRKERRLQWRHQELRRLDYTDLQKFMENRWLDQETYDQLSAMLDNLALVMRSRVMREDLTDERKTIYEQQEQLRANLNTLQSTGQEAAFRNRLLQQLEESQNRLGEIDRQLGDLAQQISDAERRTSEIVSKLATQERTTEPDSAS